MNDETEKRSNYIGTTRTFIKIPLRDSGIGMIKPGQTIEIPIIVRASGGFVYDSFLSSLPPLNYLMTASLLPF